MEWYQRFRKLFRRESGLEESRYFALLGKTFEIEGSCGVELGLMHSMVTYVLRGEDSQASTCRRLFDDYRLGLESI